jgi:23S rRNA pseudouridine955/2504/2580 synthase
LGRWPLRTKTLNQRLFKTVNAQGERHVLVRADGKEAVSHVTGLRHAVLASGQEITEVAVKIDTGRTHQIRVHLSHAGFPIIGDERYGDFALNKFLAKGANKGRMYLHAESLSLRHPDTKELVTMQAPIPPEFVRLMKVLGK